MEKKNNKKKTMLIAAFAVAVIALAGIGYATAVGYKATTVNSDNDATGIYFTATQGNYEAAFTPASEILINTYTDTNNNPDTKTLYTIDATATAIDVDGDSTNDHYAVQIGAAAGLNISLSGATTTGYTVSVKAAGTLNGTTGATDVWKYIVLIKDKYVVLDGSGEGSVSITSVGTAGDDQIVNVKLYIASTKVFENYSPLITPASGYAGNATAQVSPADDSDSYAILKDVKLGFTFTTV